MWRDCSCGPRPVPGGTLPAGVPFGSDASKLVRQGIPSIIFGPGSIDRAHAAVEYVEIDQVLEAAAFLRHFLLEFK